MKPGYVPSAGELTAHVRTGVDGAIRWVDRTLASPGGDPELWEQSSFYARMMLMRSLERGELLGWVLQRDALAEQDPTRAERLRQASSYWDDARPSLSRALDELYKSADMDPHTGPSRGIITSSRYRLDVAKGWLAALADGLAVNSLSRSAEVEVVVEKEAPETSYGLDRP